MKKISTILLTVVIISTLLSSCAFHAGYLANSASLTKANFSYVQRGMRGQATASYVFGFGGLGKETLVDAAKEDLLRNYSLQDNQTLANVTVNFKKSVFYIFYSSVTCTVTADIVEFNK